MLFFMLMWKITCGNSVKVLSLNLCGAQTSYKYNQLHANDFESLT